MTNPLLVKMVFDQALFIPGGPNVGLLGLLVGLMIALIYLVAGFAHDVSPGTLVAFTSLQFQLFTPLSQLLGTATEVSSSLVLFQRVYGYLALTPDIIDSPIAVPLPNPARGAVRLDDV